MISEYKYDTQIIINIYLRIEDIWDKTLFH